MSEEQSGWNDVEVPDQVEYEIEGKEEESPRPEVKTKEVDAQPEASVETIKELDGIETNGAQKRIRQLVKQRKDKEEPTRKSRLS